MKTKYDHQKIEKKWRKDWEDRNVYAAKPASDVKDKFYILPQLPYPSGSGLHMGHTEGYVACDIYARYSRMIGKDVLQVIGWDAFGLPAENYAIKTNVHPRVSTEDAINNFREQIKGLGISLDWDREVGSHNPDYYKWTQWFFKLMYERGLAYREMQTVNWCPHDKTVLANEQVEDGECERCGNKIELREMEQWYLKITEYADRLIADLDKVDWPEETVKRQRDWIGRSEGAHIEFGLLAGEENLDKKMEVFTTRPDTLYGVTFMVIAPEHQLISEFSDKIQNIQEVEEYVAVAKNRTELERQQSKEKTGVRLDGIKAINPLTGRDVPIFVSEYVLANYGTGAIMAVPAHDERDEAFADKYGLEKREVINSEKKVLINSEEFDGYSIDEAKPAIIAKLEELGVGSKEVTYKLRDWSISRQRFWGAPIPVLLNQAIKNEAWLDQPEKLISVHALESSSEGAYHPYVSESLNLLGIQDVVPDLPGDNMPKFKEWARIISDELDESGENTVLHGRSLGAWVALKLAETKKLRKLILVGPTTPAELEYKPALEVFGETPEVLENLKVFVDEGEPDFKKIKENVGEVVVFLSLDDPYIPVDETEKYLRENLGEAVRIIRVRDAGHFNSESGYDIFPDFVEEVVSPVNAGIRVLDTQDLPVLLPDDVDFKPTGQSPLTYSPNFQEGVEDKYGQGWQREVDTMDTFMCSSWYYFRYIDPHNDQVFASRDSLDTWMPVDYYLGGPEHVNGHLLYSRFFTKVLYDAGYIDFDEPFLKHRHQGMILGPDGKKMSKRKGNVINPTDVVEEYGADTTRMYLMFMGPLEQDKAWNEGSVAGVSKFIRRVFEIHSNYEDLVDGEVESRTHKLIKFATEGLAEQRYNVVIAELMKMINKFEQVPPTKGEWQAFIKLLAPLAPFISEEMWATVSGGESIHFESWPEYSEEKLAAETVEIGVQFNGKTRGSLVVAPDASEEDILETVKEDSKLSTYLDGKVIRKVIYIPGRILNIIIG